MQIIIQHLNDWGTAFWMFAMILFLHSAFLIVVLAIVDHFARHKARATVRYALWLLLLAKLLFPVNFSSPSGILFLNPTLFAGHATSATLGINPVAVIDAPDLPNFPVLSLTIAPFDATSRSSESRPSLSWPGLLLILWGFGASSFATLLVIRIRALKKLMSRSIQTSALVNSILDECRAQLKMTRQVQVRISSETKMPAVCGIIRATILLPTHIAAELPRAELRAVFLHELLHLKRADPLVNCLQTLLQVLYFYNPLLWLANARIRTLREQAVDEAVLATLDKEADLYPETLLKVAKLAFSEQKLSVGMVGIMESGAALRPRIKKMLSAPFPRTVSVGAAGIIAILILGAVLLPMSRGEKEEGYSDSPSQQHQYRRLPNGASTGTRSYSYTRTKNLLAAFSASDNATTAVAVPNESDPLYQAKPIGLISAEPPVERLREKIESKQAELAALSTKYHEKHPLMVSAKREIEELKKKLRNELLRTEPRVETLRETIAIKEKELAALSERYHDKHPMMLSAKSELESLKRDLQDQASAQSPAVAASSKLLAAAAPDPAATPQAPSAPRSIEDLFAACEGNAFVQKRSQAAIIAELLSRPNVLGFLTAKIHRDPGIPDTAASIESRKKAALLIGRIGIRAKPAVPALIDAFDDETDVHNAAIHTLGTLGPIAKEAVPALLEELKYRNAQAASALVQIAPESDQVINVILGSLTNSSNSPYFRSQVFGYLSFYKAKSPKLESFLRQIANDEGNPLKVEAQRITRPRKPERFQAKDIPALIERLKASPNDYDALYGLQQIGDEAASAAVPLIIDILEHKNPQFKSNYAGVVGGFGPSAKEAVPLLMRLTQSDDLNLANNSINSLGRIGHDASPAIPIIETLLLGPDPQSRWLAACALLQIDPSQVNRCLPILLANLDQDGDAPHGFDIIILGKAGPQAKAAIPSLLRFLNGDEFVRLAAAEAIVRIQPELAPKVLPLVIADVKNEQIYNRAWAAKILGQIGPSADAALPELKAHVTDPDQQFRNAVKEAVKKIEAKPN